jgi:hypothetical protein
MHIHVGTLYDIIINIICVLYIYIYTYPYIYIHIYNTVVVYHIYCSVHINVLEKCDDQYQTMRTTWQNNIDSQDPVMVDGQP